MAASMREQHKHTRSTYLDAYEDNHAGPSNVTSGNSHLHPYRRSADALAHDIASTHSTQDASLTSSEAANMTTRSRKPTLSEWLGEAPDCGFDKAFEDCLELLRRLENDNETARERDAGEEPPFRPSRQRDSTAWFALTGEPPPLVAAAPAAPPMSDGNSLSQARETIKPLDISSKSQGKGKSKKMGCCNIM